MPRTLAVAPSMNWSTPPVTSIMAEMAECMTRNATAAESAAAAGVRPEYIIYETGIGFAKTPEQDWELLRRSGEFRRLGPVLVGMSRKSFLGKFLNRPDPADRLGGTIAAALHLAGCGVEILRVHDVRQLRDALLVRAKLQE